MASPAPRMLRLPPLPTIRDLIRLYRLRALKQLSQNFLMEPKLCDKLIKCAGRLVDGQVLEVGPGPGNLTRSLLARKPSKVVVVEKDPRFLPALQLLASASPCPLDIHIDDILPLDMTPLFPPELHRPWCDPPPNLHIVGNLPFNVSTPLIVRWLRAISTQSNAWSCGRVQMTLTFQKEVAERLAAPVLSSQRCRLSVICQNYCHVRHPLTIPGKAFLPKPDVDVGVVHMRPRIEPIMSLEFNLIEKVLRNIFSFRQKFSIKGAMRLFPIQQREDLADEMFTKADLNPETRPYQITNEEYGRLCLAYKEICEREPKLFTYDHRANRNDREKRWDLFEDVQQEEDDEEDEKEKDL